MRLFLILFFLIPKSSHSLILMSIGEQKKLPSPYGEKITLSPPGLVSLQEEGPFILLKARKKGTLFLDQGFQTKRIKILSKNDKIKWEKFLNLIESIPWLHWHFSKNLQISGSLYLFEDWQKIALASQKNQIPYTLHAEISKPVKKDFLNFFKNQKFQIMWTKPLQAILPSDHKVDLFASYGIQTTQDEKKFKAPLIEIKLLLTEISSRQSRFSNSQLGLTNPLIQFQHYNNKGMGRVLTSSRLMTENKKTAGFFLGGEIPIPQYHVENKTINTNFKPYGLSLQFTPEVRSDKNIHLQLKAEISEIDNSSKGSTKNHRVHSEITIPEGQTLLLSDFQRSGFGKNQPFSLSIPFLSSIFKQKNKEKSKALIFITPRIIQP